MKFFLILPIFFSFFLGACQRKIPDQFPSISTQELSQGVKDKSLHVYDNNIASIYQAGHIPTAVFMDYLAPDVSLFPADKNAPLVFYCKNTRCSASEAGARFSWYQGYSNVRVYPDGIDGWKAAGMDLEPGNLDK
jgi:rhodanese-related sulfurtransferase